jgi:biopolymer transport protein ExbB/TolQ
MAASERSPAEQQTLTYDYRKEKSFKMMRRELTVGIAEAMVATAAALAPASVASAE